MVVVVVVAVVVDGRMQVMHAGAARISSNMRPRWHCVGAMLGVC